MSGFINAQPASTTGLANPLLQQTETTLEARLTPQMKTNYDKIVVAGLHIALQNGPRGFMAKLHDSADPIGDAAKGAAQLVMILRKEARGVMPMQAMIPAGLTLLLHALDFIDRAKIVPIAEPQIDRGTATYTNQIFHLLGITPRMLQNATQNIHQIVQDPAKMELISRKAGIVKAPGASEPTPIPGMPSPIPS